MSTIPDPIVAVFSDKRTSGASSLATFEANPGEHRADWHGPLSAALERQWDSDNHVVPYHGIDEEGEAAYLRINKRGSTFLRDLEAVGGKVVVPVLFLDYDIPKIDGEKQVWNEEALATFLASFNGQPDGLPQGLLPSYLFTTAHGARLVYVLTEPVSPTEAEGLLLGLMRDLARAGIEVDRACRDFTRFFRLAKVLRDGKRTEESPFFTMVAFDRALDPKTIAPEQPSGASDTFAEVEPYHGDMPSPEESHELLYELGSQGRERSTAWHRQAKAMLKGREAEEVLFKHAPLPAQKHGGRNNAFTFLVGSVVGMTARCEEASPEGIFALFMPVIEQVQTDETEGEDWRAVVWAMVQRFWNAELAQIAAEEQDREQAVAQGKQVLDVILARQREEHPSLVPADGQEARAWLKARLIAVSARGLYVMQPDGSYCPEQCSQTQLHARVRHLRMEGLIELHELRGRRFVRRRAQDLVDEHGIVVDEIRYTLGIDDAQILKDHDRNLLEVPLFQLRAMQPEFNPSVDAWLQRLFGEKYALGVEWLGAALDVGRPTCGLALVGEPGAGKGMAAQGLAECFRFPLPVTGEDALAQFNFALLRNPVVHFDEGIPSGSHRGGRAPSEVIRSLIMGSGGRFEQKGRDVVQATAYHRVILTANSHEILESLISGRNLTASDRRALEERILLVHVGPAAREFLNSQGDYDLTGGWVQGKGPSNHVVARHILFLHEQWKANAGDQAKSRFLVTGQVGGQGFLAEHAHRDPVVRDGVEALAFAVHTLLHPSGGNMDARLRESAVLVTESEDASLYVLQSLFERESPKDRKRGWRPSPSAVRVEDALVETGILDRPERTALDAKRRIDGRRGYWRRVTDWHRLLEIAQWAGMAEADDIASAMVQLGELSPAEADLRLNISRG